MSKFDASWMFRARELLERLPVVDREHQSYVAFKLKFNQQKLLDVMVRQWEDEGLLRIIILKARRVGMSSLVDAMLWCYCMAFPNKNVKIVTHLAGSSDELFQVPTVLAKACPGFNSKDIQAKKIIFRHVEGDSRMTMATAGTPEAGRGGTLSAVHLSEASKYPSPDIFPSMISSVSKGPGSMRIIECTANGKDGPGATFYDYWVNAQEGKNGYVPVFLSYLDDPACVRAEEEAEDAPENDLEQQLMAPPFNANKAQIAFMRRTKADECFDDKARWLTEYPHSPSVAFQVSGSPAFGMEELAFAETTIKKPMLRGRFVREGNRPRFVKDENGPLYIWKLPVDDSGRPDGNHYYIGADAAMGEMDLGRKNPDADFAAYCCICGETGELACRFAERFTPEQLADQLDLAGWFYNRAMVNIELTGNLGRWALIKLRDVYRYPYIYSWKGRDDRKSNKSKSNSIAFEMNNVTRNLIFQAARYGLRQGMKGELGGWVVNDRALMQQMSDATIKEWRWDVARGHDDILVAWMIACLTVNQYPPPKYKAASKSLLPEDKELPVQAKKEVDEITISFQQEMKQVMRRCGLTAQMRGDNQRRIDRLRGL